MEQLIKIQKSQGGRSIVSARELYQFLTDNADNVNRWMTANIANNKFATQNSDYQRIMLVADNGRSLEDYAITIDFAKELCMMSQCENGKKARQYFIECERQMLQPRELSRKELALMVIEAETAKELAEAKIKELEPKVEVYNKISNSDNLLSLNDAAKSIGIGRNKMMEWMRDNSVLRKNNTPYQASIDSGYFVVKVKPIKKGEIDSNYAQTFITGKGLVWLTQKLKS